MDTYEKQRKIFRIDALLMLVATLALAGVIPRLLQESSTGSIPQEAAIATAAAMGIRMLFLVAFLIGSRLSKRKRHINREINLAAGIVLLLLGLVLMDGAFAYTDSLLFVSIGMFVCIFCDLAVVGISVAALFILKPKRIKQPEG